MTKILVIVIAIMGVVILGLVCGIVITAQSTVIKVLKYDQKIENVTRLEIKKEMRTEYLNKLQMAYNLKNKKKVEALFEQWDILQGIEKELDKEKLE